MSNDLSKVINCLNTKLMIETNTNVLVHLGKCNFRLSYFFGYTAFKEVSEFRDLGLLSIKICSLDRMFNMSICAAYALMA